MTARPRPLVWLVDDSPLQADIGRNALAPEYEVDVFLGGAAVLEAFSVATPDLLVLDWQMPEVSGVDVCRFVRLGHDAAHFPILVLTAAKLAPDLVEAFDAGANDFVTKPFLAVELRARVAALLRNRDLHAKLAETERRLRVEGDFREGFIAMLAHDLRQPLNTFVFSNQIIAGHADAKVAAAVQTQRRAADRMTRMVTELLDFARSRPERGMPVDRQPMDIESLAQSVVDEVRIGHPEQRFEVTVEGSCVGSWDRDRLAQLCSNLLGNAIEHGDGSRPIAMRVAREAGAVVLSVTNGGAPLAAAMMQSIFSPFRPRGQSTGSGLGLGLHIVAEIARAHGATPSVQSDREGTTFTVSFPVS